ncbi:MAG: hypothetical protein A3B11_00195 [Candidatus Taylorbacteria bacterium RIFCSPLOWO2_01_FULL_44_26]|uniref:HicB-like antitoxin of toxin-antitoxin system domain-containing protein n=2 Tax=Candidatus Tayloriibacteriota TaxID=1817919 RepID=A0A1G2MLD8_9BACT|nr:MAG: hypothetical protein A3D50_01835 [Candidatus Taylorbacteria bacterium RIFCSPHIGHO2_02_FULL_44_12]OHA31110.1 MAG: hypothetical protein A3B11_00195 [Candidatus Taylorbacteria bacterium RIFCSPLOWO2_01_FULL_44_26]
MNDKILKKYRNLLPARVTVVTRKTKMGFIAEVKEFAYCFTQGRSFGELVEMLNDAIFTYLDIPEKYRGRLGIYLPEKAVSEFNRARTQEAFLELVKKPNISKSIFSRVSLVPA